MGELISLFDEVRLLEQLRKLKAEGEEGPVPAPGFPQRQQKVVALMRLIDLMQKKRSTT